MQQIGVPRKYMIFPKKYVPLKNNKFSRKPRHGSSDGGGDGRILRQHQPPLHHAQGSNIPLGHPFTPILSRIFISVDTDIAPKMGILAKACYLNNELDNMVHAGYTMLSRPRPGPGPGPAAGGEEGQVG